MVLKDHLLDSEEVEGLILRSGGASGVGSGNGNSQRTANSIYCDQVMDRVFDLTNRKRWMTMAYLSVLVLLMVAANTGTKITTNVESKYFTLPMSLYTKITTNEESKHFTLPMSFYDDRPISFTHIPKCSGTSFESEIKPLYGNQECYTAMRKDNTLNVVFLRSPRPHVRSQHGECYYDNWGKRVTKGTNFQRTNDSIADYESWLEHFSKLRASDIGQTKDFNCEDPRNTQTRHMSCSKAPNPQANHALPAPPCISLAITNLHDAGFIGITNFYHESICMLRLRQTRRLPEGCGCGESKNITTHQQVTHGVPKHSEYNLSPHVLEMVDNFTRLDKVLFVAALERFLDDIAVAEMAANRTILCDKAPANLLLKEYSDGLLEAKPERHNHL